MKKVLAMLLALVLVLSMSTVALASGISGGTEGDIIVNVNSGEVHHTRCIIIEWGNLTFTYTKGDETWNPDTKSYDVKPGTWDNGNTSTVTVTNKSDVAITVGAAITGGSADDGFAASVSTANFVLESYYGRAAADSEVITVTVTVDGDPEAVEGIAVGTVKLTIS